MTETDHCNSELSKQIQFEKDIQLFFFFSISEILQENQSPKVVFLENYAFPLNNYVQ